MNLYGENLREGKKSIHLQNKRTHNLENLEGILKENATLLETYWRIMENFLVCHPNFGWVYTKKEATEKHRFANKEA